ncbi:NADH-quinone oxidoreductase subunit NuoK [Geochorda subterranea]|uniref:NADH-quinone oxidoreductase subunit K n=1 Tax=Geochorda subterranea TaxID=3109564 RepID=A0ABZ1BT54_9FIRM|nr:NADH-quinone oxidoreductase subunit NuoK [Limnochorda sp. LNt]WRP15949.1 NADH-quinone oxidoreductase subunit NuoK [Limnochorda sp. LNt]
MPGATLEAYLAVAALLFGIGAMGVLLRRSPLAMLMSVEIMWSAAGLALVAAARWWLDMSGQVLTFLAMTVAAAEVAIGLALVVIIFRPRERVDVDDVHDLAG